jgi:hypothetical protein
VLPTPPAAHPTCCTTRQVVKEPLEQRSWIICDGDVDPEWIESLNSVLDDNRLLTLPNGERIQFASNINFIFECHSLEYASPATVSRCGMLFLSDEGVALERVVQRWLGSCPAADTGREHVGVVMQSRVGHILVTYGLPDMLPDMFGVC